MKTRKTIVVVEDNTPTRTMVTLILKESGYMVHAASTGPVGVQMIVKQKPDLVLLDLDMREMNGFDVLNVVRSDQETKDTIVVAFTAFAVVGERKRILAAGFDGYIPKPIEPETFIKEIEAYATGGRATA
ncbi:MAG: response regulator [Actinomycetota bacterium]